MKSLPAKFAFLLLAASLPLVGCGGEDGPTRYHVSGTVTYKGEPIPAGTIQFNPDASKNNRGPSGSATIKNGKFDTATGGLGTIGGPHRVTIEAYDGQPQPERGLAEGHPLFFGYETQLELPQEPTSITIDVPQQREPKRHANSGNYVAP